MTREQAGQAKWGPPGNRQLTEHILDRAGRFAPRRTLEVSMKKTYASPMVVKMGDVVAHTQAFLPLPPIEVDGSGSQM